MMQLFELKWSVEEQHVARRAFEAALEREKEAVAHEARERATHITKIEDAWALEHWLTRRRQEINAKFDFRFSVLPIVFGHLIHEGHLGENDLSGLAQEKLECIRGIAQR
jgi:hypothetical protein